MLLHSQASEDQGLDDFKPLVIYRRSGGLQFKSTRYTENGNFNLHIL